MHPRPLPRWPEETWGNSTTPSPGGGERGQQEQQQQRRQQERQQQREQQQQPQQQQQQPQQQQHRGDADKNAATENTLFANDLRRAARTASCGDTRDPCWPIAALAGFSKDG